MESCYDHGPDICNYVGEHCSTEEIVEYLSVATEKDNAVFVEYLLQQLANREELDVFVGDEVEHDGRLDGFLKGFEKFGSAIIEIGYFFISGECDFLRF